MIFWFSATGNSRYIAERLSLCLGDKRMVDLSSTDSGCCFDISCDRSVGFVFPVHSWGMPKGLPELLSSLRFDGYHAERTYCYMVCSCGDDAGLTFRQWGDAVAAAGLRADAGYSVFMPNTYVLLPGFDTDSEEVAGEKLGSAPRAVEEIGGMIKSMAKGDFTYHGKFGFLKSKVIYPLFMRFVTDRKFHVDAAKCVGCGRCAAVCPESNIDMTGGKPHWKGNCINCLACYHYCPMKCINYGSSTKNKGQYHFRD